MDSSNVIITIFGDKEGASLSLDWVDELKADDIINLKSWYNF